MPKKVETGTVTSAAASKTRRVEIPRIIRHPKYGRTLLSLPWPLPYRVSLYEPFQT